MRNRLLQFALLALCPILAAQQAMNNDAVLKLVKAGLSDDLIITTINASAAGYDTSANGLIALKQGGASDKVVAAILAKASAPQSAASGRVVDDLTSAYKKYRDSVVTVLAEYGPAKGTGFIVDSVGIVLTNEHVIGKSDWIAVQLDERTRRRAKVLAADSERDIAVLWVNLKDLPNARPVVLLKTGETPAEEGERVFTIGSPLSQTKILTTGIVSKVEDRAIISDININPGNSGGPLFNSRGQVIGITTFGEKESRIGPGVAGIVRIEQAAPLLEKARQQMTPDNAPSPGMLPLEPMDHFPIEALKDAASEKKFKLAPYVFGEGDYDVAIVTPILEYRKYSARVEAARTKEKRNHHAEAAKDTFEPLDDLRDWEEYVGEYEPVILVQASPKLVEGFWSAFGRGMAASHGYVPGPARLHFKTDFYRMELFCGEKEIQPIMPGKAERVLAINNQALRVTDATFDGLYKYPADSITPDCGKVTLKIYSEKDPKEPKVKELQKKTVDAVYRDFESYRTQEGTKNRD